MSAQQKGFTLVELIVVIVILGILAATALPRFINVTKEAREAAVDGMAGALRSAVALAQAKYMAVGNMVATTVPMVGGTPVVAAGTGIPAGTALGIVVALGSMEGFTPTYVVGPPATVAFRAISGGSATCQALYTDTGVVTTDKTGC